jgi:hypothetical protein
MLKGEGLSSLAFDSLIHQLGTAFLLKGTRRTPIAPPNGRPSFQPEIDSKCCAYLYKRIYLTTIAVPVPGEPGQAWSPWKLWMILNPRSAGKAKECLEADHQE